MEVTSEDSPGQCEGQVLGGTPGSPVGLDQTRAPKDEDARLARQQQQDEQVSPIYIYLTEGKLPADKEARELVREAEQFAVVEGVLFRVQPDKTLRLVCRESGGESCLTKYTRDCMHLINGLLKSTRCCHYWCGQT